MSELVMITDQKTVTTSLILAEKFEKQHQHVLRTIRELECSEEFRRSNFGPSSYINDQNKPQPMYQITRDGFAFLAMGFTGKKAAEFKEQFITAFNLMEQTLLEGSPPEKRIDVNMKHTRGVTNAYGLDIRYTLDLTKIIQHPTRTALALLERLTGVSLDDIVDDLPGVFANSAADVGLFVKERLRELTGHRIPKAAVYAAYIAYCGEKQLTPQNRIAFSRDLRRLCPMIVMGKTLVPDRQECYCNIELVTDSEKPA